MEQWITDIYEARKNSEQWRPDGKLLQTLEEKLREYQSAADAEVLKELLRTDYERQRQELLDLRNSLEYQKKSKGGTDTGTGEADRSAEAGGAGTGERRGGREDKKSPAGGRHRCSAFL